MAERCEAECLAGKPEACVEAAAAVRTADVPRARSLLERGCAAKLGPACAELASLHWAGDGSPQTLALAQQFDRQACELRFGPSCVALATEAERSVVTGGAFEGMAQSAAWLQQGCDAGTGAACVGLARLLAAGSGVSRDAGRAAAMALRGCELKDTAGCRLAAAFTAIGWGVTRSTSEAERLLRLGENARELTLPPAPAKDVGSLVITSTPTGARIRVLGLSAGVSPVTVALSAGDVFVEAEHSGAPVMVRRARLEPRARLAVSLDRSPAPGWLSVETLPPGAVVSVDGRPMGTPPLRLSLKPGKHTVTAALKGFQPLREQLDLAPAADEARTLTLEALPVRVRFESAPPGATLLIDGVTSGRTPLTLNVAPGGHELRFELAGFTTVSRRWAPEGKAPFQFRQSLEAVPATARLRVEVEPIGAQVFLDEVLLGPSPVETDTSPGDHLLRLSAERYETATVSVALAPGERAEKKVFLRSTWPLLQVVSAPSGALVLVDGVQRGVTPFQQAVERGRHELQVQLEGYTSQTKVVDLAPTRRESHEFVLEPVAVSPPPPPLVAVVDPALERRLLLATLVDAASPLPEKQAALQKLIAGGLDATEILRGTLPAEHRAALCAEFKAKVSLARLEVRAFDAMRDPVQATVQLDGRASGTTPLVLEVPACAQRVDVEANGVKLTRPVTLSPGMPTVVDFDFGGRPRLASLGLMGDLAWTASATTQLFSLPSEVQYSGGLRFDYWARFFHLTLAAKATSLWTSLTMLPVMPAFDFFVGFGGASSGETAAVHFSLDVGLWNIAVPTVRLTLALNLARRFFIIVGGDLHLLLPAVVFQSAVPLDQFLFPGLQLGLAVAW